MRWPFAPMNYQTLPPTPSNYLTLTNRPLPSVSSVEISSQRYTCHFKPFFFFHFCPPFYRTRFLYPKYPQYILLSPKIPSTSLPSFLHANATCWVPPFFFFFFFFYFFFLSPSSSFSEFRTIENKSIKKQTEGNKLDLIWNLNNSNPNLTKCDKQELRN
jgi:hypothetical protein